MSMKVVLGTAIIAVSAIGLASVAGATEVTIQKNLPKMSVQSTKRVMKPENMKMKPVLNLPKMHLGCKAWGSPPEFPTSLLLTNDSALSVPAGTHVHWVMNSNKKQQGNYTFKHYLAHGKSVAVPGVPGGTGRGAPCTVTFAK